MHNICVSSCLKARSMNEKSTHSKKILPPGTTKHLLMLLREESEETMICIRVTWRRQILTKSTSPEPDVFGPVSSKTQKSNADTTITITSGCWVL